MTHEFILAEGQHSFDPDSPSTWNNQTLDDAAAIFFLKRDIANLARFTSYPKDASGNVLLDGADGPATEVPQAAEPTSAAIVEAPEEEAKADLKAFSWKKEEPAASEEDHHE